MRKILPVLIALIGLGGGIGAGIVLAPPPEKEVMLPPCGPDDIHKASMEEGDSKPEPIPEEEMAAEDDGLGDPEAGPNNEYVKLNNQFVVPVVKDGRVAALVVMSLSVEVATGGREAVFLREPKLRDLFLQVLFDHANSGGFDGNFTSGLNMAALRSGLLASAKQVLGASVSDILIQDIARQDT